MKTGKSIRRQEAEIRQEKHDSLSTEEKISLAKSRRGFSYKEIKRLESQLAANQEVGK